jgi:hypothetical protein
MSKPGDTVEDLIEDGISPVAKGKNSIFSSKTLGLIEDSKEIEEDIMTIIEFSEKSNRSIFLAKIEQLIASDSPSLDLHF